MKKPTYNVLFLGSGNCARSIMAEAILNREGRERFCAYSAGIQAHEQLDRHAIELLSRLNFDTSNAQPKSWEQLAGLRGLDFDFIFTVCDAAKMLPQSMWKGSPIFARWDIPDPASVQGNAATIKLAYADAFRMLSNRIMIFINLPLRSLDRMAMQREIGSINDAGRASQKAIVAA